MKLNVIITAFNVEDFIEQCVESVVSQVTKFPFKVLVRDDGSTDSTREHLHRLATKYTNVHLILDDKNIGVHKSVEQLLSLCDSEYIATLDGDDYFVDISHFQQQVDFLDNNKNYVMSSCGVKVDRKGDLFPLEDLYVVSAINPITRKDLTESNFINFGRVFRNIKQILPLPDYYYKCYSDDWALNFKILEYGDAFCLDYLGGVYRIRKEGRLQKFSEEEIEEKNNIDRKILEEESVKDKKIITIIDCYVHNKSIENLLRKKVEELKSINKKIFLITNSDVSCDIIDKVDYFFKNNENHLFQEIFGEIEPVVFWTAYPWFTVYKHELGYQRHALSVLRNLYDALNIIKGLGYDYFERLEVDSNFNDNSLEFLKYVPHLCERENKIGLFYKNDYSGHNSDLSYHYFYSKIEEFLEMIPNIRTSQDYLDWLIHTYGDSNFKNVEIFMFKCLEKYGTDKFLVKNGGVEMNQDFGNINWNNVTSISNMSPKYKGAISKILPLYKLENDVEVESENLVIFSENKIDEKKDRRILYFKDDEFLGELRHTLNHEGHWIYNEIPKQTNRIEVYENDEFLYTEGLIFNVSRMVLR